MKIEDAFISIILVSDNKASQLMEFVVDLEPYLKARFHDYEIVIIDQDSIDDTDDRVDLLLNDYQSIRYIKLSKRVDLGIAISAGIENAIGDYVINLDVNTDPVRLIELFLAANKGERIIVGVSLPNATLCYRLIRNLSSRFIEIIGYSLPVNATGSFCMTRNAVNAITKSGRFYKRLYLRMASIGFEITSLFYEVRVNVKRKKLIDGVKEVLHYMVFNSTKPLHWMSMLGVFGSIMAFSFALYSIFINVINDNVVEGWTTTILFMSFLFAILFTMLSFFGEYLARILDDKSEYSTYNVSFEKNSSVMLDEDRQNVHFSSFSSFDEPFVKGK